MKELSIFVDESGDFGEYSVHSPYYIIALIFHDQDIDINKDIRILEREMTNIGLYDHCIHTGPVIRKEEDYKNFSIEERRQILRRLMSFVRHIDIRVATAHIDKKHIVDEVEAAAKLSRNLARLIRDNLEYFLSFEIIKIYYDNGQIELNKILASVFNTLLDNVEFRRVIPSDYRLFQVADMACTLKLIELKMHTHSLSKSEKCFFENERTLKKNYIKPFIQKHI